MPSTARRTYDRDALAPDARVADVAAGVAELRGERDLVAPAPQRLAHERLGEPGIPAVHVGGVEEGHAGIDRGVEHGARALEGLGLRALAAEVVAAEADGGDEEAGGADAARGNGEVMRPRYPAGMRSGTRRRPLAGARGRQVERYGFGASGAAGGSRAGGSALPAAGRRLGGAGGAAAAGVAGAAAGGVAAGGGVVPGGRRRRRCVARGRAGGGW